MVCCQFSFVTHEGSNAKLWGIDITVTISSTFPLRNQDGLEPYKSQLKCVLNDWLTWNLDLRHHSIASITVCANFYNILSIPGDWDLYGMFMSRIQFAIVLAIGSIEHLEKPQRCALSTVVVASQGPDTETETFLHSYPLNRP